MNLDQLQNRVRELTKLAAGYKPILAPPFDGDPIILQGHSPAKLLHTVYKTADPPEQVLDQAVFMEYLGDLVCPKVLAITKDGYYMVYLYPLKYQKDNARSLERLLTDHVWCRPAAYEGPWLEKLKESINIHIPAWALEPPCLIHGDATLDNMLMDGDSNYRITDPIPPKYLSRPNIKAVDHGRILQSILGWEHVLRGIPLIEYDWPEFMLAEDTARRAMFWCMVVLKRIHVQFRHRSTGKWAGQIAGELECSL